MKIQSENKALYMLGKCLGKPLAWVLRLQQPIVNWLTGKGLSAKFAKYLLTFFNLCILALLFVTFMPVWVVTIIMMIIAFAAVSSASEALDIIPPPPKEPEWHGGTDGFGYYDEHGFRTDAGSIDDEN